MASGFDKLRQALVRHHLAWRRARNMHSARRSSSPLSASTAVPAPRPTSVGARDPAVVRWIGAAGALAALGAAVLIAAHARQLTLSVAAGGAQSGADVFQAALPGALFSVPAQPSITLLAKDGGALLIAAGMHSAPAVRLDLCSQMLDRSKPRLLPLRIGYRFEDVARLVARNDESAHPATLRNIALTGALPAEMPQVLVSGSALPNFAEPAAEPLQLRWDGRSADVRWIGDASFGQIEQGAHGQVALRQDGWLVWGRAAALRIQRQASASCPQAGQLLLQLYRAADAGAGANALVAAYPAKGQPVAAWLRAGEYQVPSGARAGLEDQALFEQLQQRALVRVGAHGLIELAPRDLAAWRAAPLPERAAGLAGWNDVRLDADAAGLLKRLYRMADGDYVREQVRVFNSERRLLAWRVKPASADGDWRASVGSAPAATATAMPAAAVRLFAELPQDWAPWTRIASWPQAEPGAPARLTLALPHPAAGGEIIQLMLIGQMASVQGARLRMPSQGLCSGRACPAPDAVQLLTLELLPGARTVALDARPLALAALAAPADQQYRHLRVTAGRLEWKPLAAGLTGSRLAARAGVTLTDRHGTPLWGDGAPTEAARDAGLAALLGIRADHASSIAGMLARLPAPGGTHAARLTLDLGLQAASQRALDCLGMRHGQWDGKVCSGGRPVPAGRHAGIVILDTETGDILAAAGAGTGSVNAANWSEVRDFDRSNPARSPLRLPALQHDGGAHQSPGSTFKVISALGLEQAARGDPQIDALLAGMPLAALNRLAQQKGFAFRTDAASYPANTRLAHITNYRDQYLDRRAQDGRLGLSQALTYSLNTWFAWSGELSDRSLFGRAEGGAPDLQPLEAGALDSVRPIVGMAHRLGFEQALRLDGALLPPDYAWSAWDALQASASHIDPVHTRHELRQMAIGLRMQVTPLQMALAAGAVGQGSVIAPRLLLSLDGRQAAAAPMPPIGVRLDRIRSGMKGVVDVGTAAGAFRGARFDNLRRGLSGKTGTSPSGPGKYLATVWFTGWLEPGSLPGQTHRLALSAFVSHSESTGGDHAAPIVAAVLASQLGQDRSRNREQH